uniref:Uncharacterized protein n=1 Tax=Myripristis murdjan TaxID=586833 RepID=A0A667Y4I9_9TELE
MLTSDVLDSCIFYSVNLKPKLFFPCKLSTKWRHDKYSPLTPDKPGSPLSPGRPSKPLSPCIPLRDPSVPLRPFSPRGPSLPLNPIGPGGPYAILYCFVICFST